MHIQKEPNQFRPITLVLDTQEDVDRLSALLNCKLIAEAVGFDCEWRVLNDYTSPAYLELHKNLMALLN